MLALASTASKREVREMLINVVEASFQGELEIGEVSVEPFSLAAEVHGVKLLAPEGEEALRASRARVLVDPASLLAGTPRIVLALEEPWLDLTPDADGTTPLSRALAPDAAPEDDEGGPSLGLEILLTDGALVRGAPPGDPDGMQVAVTDIAFAASLDFERGRTKGAFAGGGRIRVSPAPGGHEEDRAFTAQATLESADGLTVMKSVRVATEGTWIAADDVRLGGEKDPAARVAAVVRAADAARWTGRTVPGDLLLEGVAGDGVATALARVRGGPDTVAVHARRGEDGRWKGAGALSGVSPAGWGVPEGGSDRLEIAAGFAVRPQDGAWAVRVRSAPFAWRGSVFEPVDVAAQGLGAEHVDVRLASFSVRDGTSVWHLARPARLLRRGSVLGVEGLTLTGPRGQLVSVEGTWPPASATPLLVRTERLSVAELPSAFLPEGTTIPRGRIDLAARLTEPPGPDGIPGGRASVRVRRLRVSVASALVPSGPYDAVANATLAGGRARVTADVRAAAGESLRLFLDAPMHVPGARDSARVDLAFEGVALRRLPDVDGRIRVSLHRGRAWLIAHASSGDRDLLHASGAGEADIAAFLKARTLPELAIWVERFDAGALSAAGLLPAEVAGVVRGALTSSPRDGVRGTLTASGVRAAGYGNHALTIAIRGAGSDLRAGVRASVGEVPAESEGTRGRRRGRLLAGAIARLNPPLERVPAEGLRSVRWALRGALTALPLSALESGAPPALSSSPDVSGRVDGGLSLEGVWTAGAALTAPRGWAWAKGERLRFEGQDAGGVFVASHLARNRIAVWVDGEPHGGGKLAALARLGPLASGGSWSTAPLSVIAAADDLALAAFAGLVPVVTDLAGTLTLRGTVSGTIAAPEPSGTMTLDGGAFATRDTGVIRDIELRAAVAPDRIHVRSFSARGTRGGPLSGSVDARRVARTRGLPQQSPYSWTLHGGVRARNFTLDGERFAGRFDGGASLAGRLAHPNLVARLELEEGTITLPDVPEKEFQPLDDHPDFVVITARDEEAVAVAGEDTGAAPAPKLRLSLKLDAPDNLHVTGRDIDLLLSANLLVKTGGEEGMTLQGEVRALRGEAKIAGKDFRVENALVGFPGAPVDEGRLDISAVHEVESANPDEEDMRVFARIGGTIGDPRVELTSDPPLPEDAVVSLLFLGATTPRSREEGEGSQPSLAGRAATFVGNYLTQRFRDQVQDVVPVDVLELETGAAGSSSEGRIRVGKYLGPGLFLSYAHSFGADEEEGANTVRLEWRLRRRWQVVSEITDGNRGHVDLVWTREF